MADPNWRANPKIARAREWCKEFGDVAVVVIGFQQGRYSVSSYGRNGALCGLAGKFADTVAEGIERQDLPVPGGLCEEEKTHARNADPRR